MIVDKDTKLYCSFAKKAGSTGCMFHNSGFAKHKINAIYKSFSVDRIDKAVQAMRVLDIKGAGITMPFKTEVLDYIDNPMKEVLDIDACNTLVNNNGIITGYNTDYLSVADFLAPLKLKNIIVLGNGGYSKAVKTACNNLKINVNCITRSNWKDINDLKEETVFNCTPVENIKLHESNYFIDCIVSTSTGRKLANQQAAYQFKIYTGVDY